MFDITCEACTRRYLVGTRAMRSFRNTLAGPVAVVACPAGHLVEQVFRASAAPADDRMPVACPA